jgi:small subunit ribosomal protein S16
MPTKIRLQRRGKRGMPFYHIVIADGRAPRDGRFIEKLGTYNPLSKPVEIELDFDRAIDWLQKGAQPSDTVRSLLSFKGVIYKNHLINGVKKGAMTMEQAEIKFQSWQTEKQEKHLAKIKESSLSKKEAKKKKLDAEVKVNEERARQLAAKRAKELEKSKAIESSEKEVTEVTVQAEPAVSETPVTETAVVEEPVTEIPAEEIKAVEEPVAEIPTDEIPPIEEPVAETPAEKAPDTEAPKEEAEDKG